jgi:hypothetical protein
MVRQEGPGPFFIAVCEMEQVKQRVPEAPHRSPLDLGEFGSAELPVTKRRFRHPEEPGIKVVG